MRGLLEMTPEEGERLVWIHSNRFTVPDLFHRKFMPHQTYRHACRILAGYVEKEFLHLQQETVFQRADYYLTAMALRTLDAQNKLLVRRTKYPVRINQAEKTHDLRVQTIRIAFEASPDLGEMFWVSDFEMRSGISPSVKAEFLEGKLDKKRWRSQGYNPNPKGRRTPDGYFEADYEGRRMGFVLEYEHHPYGDRKMGNMAGYLKDGFSHALKLVVSADSKQALRMVKALQEKVGQEEQEMWFVTDYESAASKSFKGIWRQLDQPLDE